MIRNIIFDMVGVLMRFDTESYIEEHHLSEEDVAILRKEVFRSLEWATGSTLRWKLILIGGRTT